ncbi:MAG: cupin domain-containing protein [Cyanobacteria bacterium P01_F01_bin.153]
MTKTLLKVSPSHLQLKEAVEYPQSGFLAKGLLEDDACKYTLLCLAKGASIAEHSAPRNATVQVIEGTGILTLEGEDIPLKPGAFIVMPARSPHSLKANSDLAFVLTFSE